RARLPWLTIGIAGSLVGARFMGLFEGDIAQIPAMAFFIPLITATGGNVGIQSTSIVLRSLANRSAFNERHFERFSQGFFVSLINWSIVGVPASELNMIRDVDME